MIESYINNNDNKADSLAGPSCWFPGLRTLLVLWVLALSGAAAFADFDQQRKAVSASTGTQPESAIISLLKAGIDESKPTQAIAEAQKWLRQNQPTDSMLLYYAGRAAELSGDWSAAVALYKQYLSKADLMSDTAGDASFAVYSLQIDHLSDPEGAYAYSRNGGNRLVANPKARQFDMWFLDMATRRRDRQGVADRLRACVKAGISDDLLTVHYYRHFRWLLDSINGARYDQERFTEEFYTGVKALAGAITFDEELKLLLDWAVSVKYYNMSKIDGKDVEAPLELAKSLLERYPRYAFKVQTDWAGGSNSQHYRDDPKKYWPHEAEGKIEPIMAAVAKLSPIERSKLFASWSVNYYQRGPQVFTVEQLKDYVLANTEYYNNKAIVSTGLQWEKLTLEDMKELAPLLGNCSAPEVSVIRAIAQGGKDFDNVIDALLGSEVWRLNESDLNGRWVDQIWHWTARPGGSKKRDEQIRRAKEVSKVVKQGDVMASSPADLRMAAFKKLWADFNSDRPKNAGVRARLVKVLQVTDEAIVELLDDMSPHAQMLVRDAIAKGLEDSKGPVSRDKNVRGLGLNRYDPLIFRVAARNRGMDWLRQHGKDMYKPHPMGPVLGKAISDQLGKGNVPAWLVMAWINAQFPENNDDSVKLMKKFFGSSDFRKLPSEVRFGARQWFKEAAMTPGQYGYVKAADPKIICKELLALPNDASVSATVSALSSAIDGLKKSPVRVDIAGLNKLAVLKDSAVFEDPKVVELMLEIADPLRSFHYSDYDASFTERFRRSVLDKYRPDKRHETEMASWLTGQQGHKDVLHRTAAYFWRHTEMYHRCLQDMIDLSESLIDENPSAASAIARCGLQTIARHRRGHTYYKADTDIPKLKSIRGRAAMKMGLMVIPVAKTDPAYPIYKSQAEWMTGNADTAWTLVDANWDQLIPLHRELSMPYMMWVLQRVIMSRDDLRQEDLIKSLLGWAGETSSPLTNKQKAELEIAYGDIAVQRGMLPEAHAIFIRTQKNAAYDGLLVQYTATLRRAMVERISENYDEALKTLGELEMKRIPSIWAAVHYARAEVYYDMEEYDDSFDEIATILQREPKHSEAKIMQGRLQLKRKKLMEATEVEVGPASAQDTLVPGEKLKVTLNDPTLAVSGAGTEIEVVVWTESGDKERFFLRQFGDVKTKFRGEVMTALGEPSPDDRVLQVIGDDKIYYAYSERFRKKMNNMAEKRGGPIGVASDAMLTASARALLSETEQLIADRERIEEILADKDLSADRTDLETLNQMQAEIKAANERRLSMARVKPGNPIHVRVVDPDRGRTKEIDQLTISVESSSGDSINRIVLKETGTHSGRFQGTIPTTVAQAMAFAANSEPGRNPNMVISPKTYPSWKPVAKKDVTPEFLVDLNDNAALGQFKIKSDEQGSKLKRFVLQTAMNSRDWTTVACYPKNSLVIDKPWEPSVSVVIAPGRQSHYGGQSVYDFDILKEHLRIGWLREEQSHPLGNAYAQNVSGPSNALPEKALTGIKWMRGGRWPNPAVSVCFKAYFYEPENVVRRFSLSMGKHVIKAKDKNQKHPPQFLIAVDGRIITEEGGKLEGQLNLRAGIHRFELWATGWVENIGFGRTVKLQANLEDDEVLSDCPDSFFDPKNFPKGVLSHRNGAAKIAANAAGTEFDVQFAEGSRCRMLKLIFVENEGTVPAINKLELTSPDGKKILPVPVDFAELNKNDTLEILTGDKVAIRYVDDRFVTKGRQKHERLLHVAFTSAKVEFADIEPRFSENHQENKPYYEKLLHFPYGKPLSMVIRDADMDTSVQPDKVEFVLESKSGVKRKLVATETGPSTGIFRAFITPVGSATSDDSQIQVPDGDTLTIVYLDKENTSPGVPTERFATIEHASFKVPRINLSHATVSPVDPKAEVGTATLTLGFTPLHEIHLQNRDKSKDKRRQAVRERILPRWSINNELIDSTTPPPGGFEVVHGRRMYLELLAPHMALGTASTVTVYAQTDSGRQMAARMGRQIDENGFNISVPGTMAITATLPVTGWKSDWRQTPEMTSYINEHKMLWAPTGKLDRFRVEIPLIAGILPEHGVLSKEERYELRIRQHGLVVKGDEKVHIGFRYKDQSGAEKWLTASAKVVTHPTLDLMHESYREPMNHVFVGENLYLRVTDLGRDISDGTDKAKVLLQVKSGAKHYVELTETDVHSGVFKGVYTTTYLDDPAVNSDDQYNVKTQGFPVLYDDIIASRYSGARDVKTPIVFVKIGKGADGSITPFSKKFEDNETAMSTQFALAESYLELSRRHRKLGVAKSADVEFARAKQLLTSAISRFRDPSTRARAEYLLGNMTLEEAETTKDPELKKSRYHAALARFMKVTGSYPDTLYASSAQYKTAVTYERLKEPDIAAQEYVKLAYKYPDSEYLATSMLRLGTHFQRKAYAYERKADALLEKLEDKDAQHEGKAIRILSNREYIKAAQIFARLQERFGGHEHAGTAGLRSGQAYMRAGKTSKAIDIFLRVIDNEGYDGKTIRSQAMYWAGKCYQAMNQQLAAYSIYKRLTYDFPESKWAAYARGELSDPRMVDLDTKLEIKQLEEKDK